MRAFLTATLLGLGLAVSAQEPNDMLELLRSDLRTERDAIVMNSLALSAKDSATFAPIYEAYVTEMRELWNKRLALVDDYTKVRENMGPGQANDMMKRLFTLEREDIDIREKYAQKMTKVLPATVAARWVQIERRMGQLMELQVANEVPLVPKKH